MSASCRKAGAGKGSSGERFIGKKSRETTSFEHCVCCQVEGGILGEKAGSVQCGEIERCPFSMAEEKGTR